MTENNRQQKERGLFLTKEMLEGLEFFCPNTPVIVYSLPCLPDINTEASFGTEQSEERTAHYRPTQN